MNINRRDKKSDMIKISDLCIYVNAAYGYSKIGAQVYNTQNAI